ncbi:MAG: division plane positioning ATPase MipZ, partial [Geminicoccales bacterium]
SLRWFVVISRRANQDSRNRQRLGDALDKLAPALGFEALAGLSERVIFRELFLFGLTLLDLGAAKGKASARSAAVAAGIDLTLGHVAARQELRQLLALTVPEAAGEEPARAAARA